MASTPDFRKKDKRPSNMVQPLLDTPLRQVLPLLLVIIVVGLAVFFIPSYKTPPTVPRGLYQDSSKADAGAKIPPAPAPHPTIIITPEQQQLLDEAIQYRITARNNLNTMALDGHRKIFAREKIDAYMSQLGSLPQTNEVIDALLQLKTLNDTYYQNGYRKDEYELLPLHKVQTGETLYQIAQKYGVTADEIRKYNPMDFNGGAVGKNTVLVIYRKWKK